MKWDSMAVVHRILPDLEGALNPNWSLKVSTSSPTTEIQLFGIRTDSVRKIDRNRKRTSARNTRRGIEYGKSALSSSMPSCLK